MKILGNILSGGATELVDSVGKIVDNLVTTKKEKLEAKQKVKETVFNFEKEMQKEVSARWISDNNGSWLTQNIRPLALAFLTFMFVIISIFSGNIGDFKIEEDYIPVYQTLLVVVYTAYFGGRSFEKIKKINNDKKA
jgi:hypothetical protein